LSGIFLSRASRNDREAVALRKWLSEKRSESVDEIFLDISGQSVRHSEWEKP
jgi:hypothetical protein